MSICLIADNRVTLALINNTILEFLPVRRQKSNRLISVSERYLFDTRMGSRYLYSSSR